MYGIRHRVDGSYFHGTLGAAAIWRRSPEGARPFLTPEDAFNTAYVTCITTDPNDLVIVQLPPIATEGARI